MTNMQRLAALALSISVWAGFAESSSPAPASALLHPEVRAAEIRMARLAELRSDFADPPAEYRPMPLWVWNDQMSWPRIQEQLRQFKQQGMGGVFVHPRPGLMTEYLGADWFRLWKMTLEEGKRLGLLVNIYDENSFPAGFAGGAVPAVRPDTVSQYVEAELDADRDILHWREKTISCFAAEKTADGEVRSVRRVRSAAEIPPGHSLLDIPSAAGQRKCVDRRASIRGPHEPGDRSRFLGKSPTSRTTTISAPNSVRPCAGASPTSRC